MKAIWLAALVGCAAAPPSPRVAIAETTAATSRQDLYVDVVSKHLRATYEPSAMRPSDKTVALRITNAGSVVAPIVPLDVAFRVEREGVTWPCAPSTKNRFHEREPLSLAPGHVVVIEREIDCAMPLPGRWEVGIVADVSHARHDAGTVTLDVESVPGRGPRPFLTRPGLHGFVVADRVSRPLSPSAWEKGVYAVVVALVNGSRASVSTEAVRVSFLVQKRGAPLPCVSRTTAVDAPTELGSGVAWQTKVPLACASADEGRYDVTARLTVGNEEIEAGRFSLFVSDDPFLFGTQPTP